MYKIAVIAISNSTRKFDKEYHYIISHEFIDVIDIGIRVIVPFGRSNRLVEGYVLDIIKNTKAKTLKNIKDIIDNKPLLSPSMIRLAKWMKKRYICTYSDAIRCMLPPGVSVKSSKIALLKNHEVTLEGNSLKIVDILNNHGGKKHYEELKESIKSTTFTQDIKKLTRLGVVDIVEEFTTGVNKKYNRVAFITKPISEIIDEIESNSIKSIKQIRVLEMLIESEYIPTSDIMRFSGVSYSVLNTLKKNGYIDFKEIEVKRDPYENIVFKKTFPLEPTEQQAVVLAKIRKILNEGKFKEILLHGVTGSGKTEVYLQLIQNCIDKGKQAIVLVPEISLTPQMVARFKGRFGNDVAVLHSRLSLGERYDQWRVIKEGETKVVVGARSAVFAPLNNLGLIVIDEEHETSYKSEITPKYQASDVARIRCIIESAILICGSATPSVETYYKAKTGKIELMEMTKRANNMVLPKAYIIDMRDELSSGNRMVFSSKLYKEMEKNIEKDQQTIIFLNRRGYASFILCRSCGFTLMCPNCNITLTYHAYDKRLICHYCGYTTKKPNKCPKCESIYIRSFGTGTQKIEEEVKRHFEGSTVLRMDMDTTMRKNSHEQILTTFREENINIMVGTQMIAKGHDFPNVTLVGVIAADSLLNTGDYKATEKTFQLITQVAGRAGRGTVKGRVIIQTYNTENFSIICACNHDYHSFYKNEILLREKLLYPPFTNLASVILSGPNDKEVINKVNQVKKNINESFKGIKGIYEVLGPLRAPLSKIKNKYRWRIIIKCDRIDILLAVLTKITDDYYNINKRSLVNLSVDINPVNML